MKEMTERLAADPALAAAYQDAHEKYLAARAELGGSVFETAWTEGQHMTLDQAVEYALQLGEVDSASVR